ncbi:hypothetical protein SUGI_0737050 [Cryptomeria japonica]|nr:hypothetical protein SUGI_0737050 [Cryptomeria japonica]
MIPRRAIKQGAINATSEKEDSGYSKNVGDILGPAEEHIVDDAQWSAAIFCVDPADQILEVGLLLLYGFRESKDRHWRKGAPLSVCQEKSPFGE